MINFLNKQKYLLGRIVLFSIFFWYGYLKVIGVSPAEDLVKELFSVFHLDIILPFKYFFIAFWLFEMLIGIGFLIGKYKKILLLVFLFHMFTTFLPVIFLPELVWQSFGVLTLAGQYIIKNLVLIILGVFLLGRK